MRANRSISVDRAPVETSRDALLGGRLTLLQPVSGYRVAIDPVLLAASIGPDAGPRVLDLGCGVGAIGLCLLARLPDLQVTGLDIDPLLVGLAERNAAGNGVRDRFRAVLGSVASPPADAIPAGAFDLVVVNPPFRTAGQGSVSPVARKRTAMVGTGADLGDWVRAGERALRAKGRIAVIFRADGLAGLLAALDGRFGEITVHPLWPGAGKAARRVIVHARKAVASPLRLTAGTILHDAGGGYAPAAAQALDGGGLSIL